MKQIIPMTLDRPPGTSRRRFVQGLALASVGGALGSSAAATSMGGAVLRPTELTGDKFDLAIGESRFNVTGRSRVATTVNGSLPAPTLRFREGDTVTLNVTNHLREPTSIHWHGLRLHAQMDGVPGLSFRGIMPGETFVYRFPIVQTGTYWYHGHSGMQEQTGLYGPLILQAKSPSARAQEREHVILLSDWTDEDPRTVVSNLKMRGDYYNFHHRTLGTFAKDSSRKGLAATLASWSMWGRMRMSPTDIMDVTGATYTFLVNGMSPAANWTGLFEPGEPVRLRFINGSSMSTFDVRIPGLPLQVVAADGSDVEPVQVDQFCIGVAETYDVIVQPTDAAAYTIFAQAEDRTGYARATLAPRAGMSGPIPPMDPRPMRDVADMGMAGMAGMNMGSDASAGGGIGGMAMGASQRSSDKAGMAGGRSVNADHVDPESLDGAVNVDNVAMHTQSRQAEAGAGLASDSRRTLRYADLKALNTTSNDRLVDRDIEFHLTGNMQRWTWGFGGKKFSQADAIRVRLGERVRFVLINDTMMEHPIHLNGFLFLLENGNDGRLPLKHTVNIKPGERVSFLYTADTPGHWAFHCHLLYHMETGMFRTVLIA